MRKSKPLPYLLLLAVLLLLMSVSALTSDKIRGHMAAFLSPIWQLFSDTKFRTENMLQSKVEVSSSNPNIKSITVSEEMQRLELENKLLYAELVQLRDLVDNKESLKVSQQAVPARVIFRAPSSWYSSFWINLGYKDNDKIGPQTVARNSPVVVGKSVIGVIDYVGPHQSRVRLITDSGLTPSVRALRNESNREWHLAKGEIRGDSKPLWRSVGQTLHGIGFNYDFADDKGPARDLRSGEPLENKESVPTMPLLKVNDILVTTGMDGVFPADLHVAVVTKIYPLKEGDYYYEIEAEPTAGKLDDLSLVFVLPPLGYDPEDQPNPIGR